MTAPEYEYQGIEDMGPQRYVDRDDRAPCRCGHALDHHHDGSDRLIGTCCAACGCAAFQGKAPL